MTSPANVFESGTHQTTNNAQPLAKSTVTGFYGAVVLFNLCLNAQILSVGLAYFYDPAWWSLHVWLVRSYSGLSLILLGWAYWAPFPQRIRALSMSFPILLGLQFLTIHVQTPLPFPLAVFHPLIGFSLFAGSTTLVHRVWHLIRPAQDESKLNPA